MDPHTVQQQPTHQTRHAGAYNANLLALLASYEGVRVVLGLEIRDTVKPGAVRVVETRQRRDIPFNSGPLLEALFVHRNW